MAIDLCSIPTCRNKLRVKMSENSFCSLTIIHIIHIMIIILSGKCPASDHAAARISQTQGAFCPVELFGAGTHQEQRCAPDILQPVSCEAVLRQSPPGPRHDSATGYRPWSLCRFAQYSLVCSGITPFFCLCYIRHWIQVLRMRPCVDVQVGNIRRS